MKIASMSAMAIGIIAGVGAAAAVGMSRHNRKRLQKMAERTASKIARKVSSIMP